MTKSTSIGGNMCNMEKTDGSQSDTAVSLVGLDDKKRRSSIGAKMSAMVGMSRKSRSTSQLSQTGRGPWRYLSLPLFLSLSSYSLSLSLSLLHSRSQNLAVSLLASVSLRLFLTLCSLLLCDSHPWPPVLRFDRHLVEAVLFTKPVVSVCTGLTPNEI